MAHAILLAWSSPSSPEHEDEFNSWYTKTHIPQLKSAVPGITAVHRYRLVGSGTEERPARYLCTYELGGTDADAAAAALASARTSGAFDMSTSLDVTEAPPVLEFVEPIEDDFVETVESEL